MNIFSKFLFIYFFLVSTVEGLHIKYVENVSYYVKLPDLRVFSDNIHAARDISKITYTNNINTIYAGYFSPILLNIINICYNTCTMVSKKYRIR